MINATLYSLESFEATGTECQCELKKVDDYIPEIKCSWPIDLGDSFKYVSVALSTFSIAHAILSYGYKEIVYDLLSSKKRILFQGFGLLNLMYGMTIGVYQVYIAGMTKTPWFFLLVFPLILRMAPINVWYRIFSEIFPILKSVRYFSCLPIRFKTGVMVCSLFWFAGLTLGLNSLADLLRKLSRDVHGKATSFPFESVFPSIDLPTKCIGMEQRELFECFQFRGWIDESMGRNLLERAYPKYFVSATKPDIRNFDEKDFDRVMDGMTYFENLVPSLRMMFGNYWLWDLIFAKSKDFLFIDFVLVSIFALLLILSATISLKEKVATFLILTLQISPLPVLYRRDEANIIGATLALMVAAFAVMTVVITVGFLRGRNGLSSMAHSFLKWSCLFSFILIPFYSYVESFYAYQNFRQTFAKFRDFCLVSEDQRENVMYMEARQFIFYGPFLSPRQLEFIDSLKSLEIMLFKANYFSVFCAIFGPILWVAASIPLLSMVAVSVSTSARFRRSGNVWFHGFFIASTLGASLYLTKMKPRHVEVWDWSSLKNLELKYFRFELNLIFKLYGIDLETIHPTNQEEMHFALNEVDLETTNSTVREAMLYQVRNRLGPIIHDVYGLNGCGFLSFNVPHTFYLSIVSGAFFDLRAQYIALSLFRGYPDMYFLILIPCSILLGTYFFVCKP